MSERFPPYKDYNYDEYQRNLVKITPGSFIEDITYEEAMNYFQKNQFADSIIKYTLSYIESQVGVALSSYYIKELSQLQPLLEEKPPLSIVIAQLEGQFYGLLWNSRQLQTLMVKRNEDLIEVFKDQKNRIVDTQNPDLLSSIAFMFIATLPSRNFNLNFQKYENLQLIKWALTKVYRLKQIKENGESFSRILDDQLLEDVNKSQQHQFSKNSLQPLSFNSKSIQSIGKKESSRYSESIKSFNSEVVGIKQQITSREFTQMLGDFKKQVLTQYSSSQVFPQRDYLLKPINPYVTPEQVVSLKVQDLETILKEQVKNKKIETSSPIDDLQQLLSYYYQNNQEQYKLLLNQYSHLIHEKMFENMGLPNPDPPKVRQQSQFLGSHVKPHVSPKSYVYQDTKLQPKLFQEELMAKKYNRSVNKQEFLLLKERLVLTQNLMEFYFSYLNDMVKSILIFPVEFYEILSQTNYEKAKRFTDQFQGKNHTIFDLFQKLFIPVKISQYEFVGIYIEFSFQTLYYINTLERKDRRLPNYKELIDIPIVQFMIKFLENEYQHKLMKPFNILSWSIIQQQHLQEFVEFRNEYATTFNHSGLVLTYVFDSIINNQSATGDNKKLQELAGRILNVVRKSGIQK